MNEGELSGVLGCAAGPPSPRRRSSPGTCCSRRTSAPGCTYCHVSTAGSVEILRWAKSKGWNVTAEVTPQPPAADRRARRTYDPAYKVNPPLRASSDVQALREALADGTIDAVATAHAPTRWRTRTASGPPRVRDARAGDGALVVQAGHGRHRLLDWAGVADRMAVRPARIGRLTGQGCALEVGGPANVVLVDPSARWTVDPRARPRAAATRPYAGGAAGRVVATFLRGRPTVLDGKLA
jgi:dihydroorotase